MVLGYTDTPDFKVFDVGSDVTVDFILKNVVHVDHDARFLHHSEFIMNASSEDPHGGGKVHVGIHQRRYVAAQVTDVGVQNFIVFLKVISSEKVAELSQIHVGVERNPRIDQPFGVREITVKEV